MAQATTTRDEQERAANPPASDLGTPPKRTRPWLLEMYGTAVGKKYAMALSGIAWMGYVLAHMVGNLKVYLGDEDLDHYAEWLRNLATPALPRTVLLWGMRSVLIVAIVVHIHAAWSLTRTNWGARGGGYKSDRDYVVANFASRTMRWTGIIVGLFIVFHLFDLTWGQANPDFERGHVHDNLVASFERVPVAVFYVLANLALGLHLFHGAWSLFQSMGWSHPRFNQWRRWFAWSFAAVITLGNITFPVMVQAGVID
jgi:succinate dehydrogenase / fumarate reductase cytochrome b subunit